MGILFEYRTKTVLGEKGRIVIPAKIREDLQIEKGDSLVIECVDGIIKIYPIYEGEEK